MFKFLRMLFGLHNHSWVYFTEDYEIPSIHPAVMKADMRRCDCGVKQTRTMLPKVWRDGRCYDPNEWADV